MWLTRPSARSRSSTASTTRRCGFRPATTTSRSRTTRTGPRCSSHKRSPGAWVKNIDVPIFWVGAFQDEQTGGHWPEAVRNLPKDNKDVWVTMQNGVHVDSLGPSTITRWAEFMNLFTGNGRIPRDTAAGARPRVRRSTTSWPIAGSLPIQQSRYADMNNTPTNVAAAKADFRKDPRIRLLMDNGAASPEIRARSARPGRPASPTGRSRAPSRPTYFLGKGGTLTSSQGARGLIGRATPPIPRPVRPRPSARTPRVIPGRPSRPTTGSRLLPARVSGS